MENYQEEDQRDFVRNDMNSTKEERDTVNDEQDSENEEQSSSKKEKKSPKEESESSDWSISPETDEEYSERED